MPYQEKNELILDKIMSPEQFACDNYFLTESKFLAKAEKELETSSIPEALKAWKQIQNDLAEYQEFLDGQVLL